MRASSKAPESFRWQHAATAFLLYTGITLVFFSSTLYRLDSHVIGSGSDVLQVFWDAWWLKQSLFQGHNPFFTDILFHPFGTPLALHELYPVQTTSIALLSSVLPVEFAYNLVVLAALPITGIAGYFLCRFVTRDDAAGMVGGLVLMLSPAIVSRVEPGWLNLLYAGIMPLYFLVLIKAVQSSNTREWLLSSLFLAAMALLVEFTGNVNVVIAANLTFVTYLWKLWETRQFRDTTLRFGKALLPAAIVAAPYVLMILYYVTGHGLNMSWPGRLDYIPDVLSYLFPFHTASLYSDLTAGMDLSETARRDLAKTGTACYLGLAVLPLSLTGFYLGRRDPAARMCLAILAVFLVLSMGPRLLIEREALSVMGHTVPMPYVAWRHIPLLGGLEQSGRLILIVYMMMGVGLAYLAAGARRRMTGWRGNAAAGLLAAAVCIDYAISGPEMSELPDIPDLEYSSGTILDPSFKNAYGLYLQTHTGMPLVGGYLSKTPRHLFARYSEIPGMACLFLGRKDAACDLLSIMDGLQELDVSYILLPTGDWRNGLLEQYGFSAAYYGGISVLWSVPGAGEQARPALPDAL